MKKDRIIARLLYKRGKTLPQKIEALNQNYNASQKYKTNHDNQ